MSVKKTGKLSPAIYAADLYDGQLAEVVGPPVYQGKVVQRYGDYLVCIGEASGEGWSSAASNPNTGPTLRILGEGEILTVVENTKG